jgi:hypothetical protein
MIDCPTGRLLRGGSVITARSRVGIDRRVVPDDFGVVGTGLTEVDLDRDTRWISQLDGSLVDPSVARASSC